MERQRQVEESSQVERQRLVDSAEMDAIVARIAKDLSSFMEEEEAWDAARNGQCVGNFIGA